METSERMVTEQVNPASADIDKKSSLQIVQVINDTDKTIADAVERVLPEVAAAVDLIVAALRGGGRLFYIGAGTSGRLGIIDAAECPPTFGVSPDTVQGIIAGGPDTVFRAREGCEDDADAGGHDLAQRGLSAKDVVVGISTSGRTPYVCGALIYARQIGTRTIGLLCNPDGAMVRHADVAIRVVVGPEVITGSTRMKAGTAEKMVLNMLSTASMIRMGRVTGNQMTDMQITCGKLRERAARVVMTLANVDEPVAQMALEKADGNVKTAVEIARGGAP